MDSGIFSLRDLAGHFAFDFSVIDLALWFPYLSWPEFAASAAAVLSWCWLSCFIENTLNAPIRRRLIALLKWIVGAIRP